MTSMPHFVFSVVQNVNVIYKYIMQLYRIVQEVPQGADGPLGNADLPNSKCCLDPQQKTRSARIGKL